MKKTKVLGSSALMKLCSRCDSPVMGTQCRFCGHWLITDNVITDDGSKDLADVVSAEVNRIDVGPFNFVWSGPPLSGLVQTSVTLFAGIPGAGKTTMLLQLTELIFEKTGKQTGIIATEQSEGELRLYADRLNVARAKGRARIIPAMTGEVNVGAVLRSRQYGLIILDSLQGLVGDEHGPSVDVCKIMKRYAVEMSTPVVIVSHVNKQGDFAGLMALQHEVDVLMIIECDEAGVRMVRTEKNRFGPAYIGSAFEMTEAGLFPIAAKETDNDDEKTDDDK